MKEDDVRWLIKAITKDIRKDKRMNRGFQSVKSIMQEMIEEEKKLYQDQRRRGNSPNV